MYAVHVFLTILIHYFYNATNETLGRANEEGASRTAGTEGTPSLWSTKHPKGCCLPCYHIPNRGFARGVLSVCGLHRDETCLDLHHLEGFQLDPGHLVALQPEVLEPLPSQVASRGRLYLGGGPKQKPASLEREQEGGRGEEMEGGCMQGTQAVQNYKKQMVVIFTG